METKINVKGPIVGNDVGWLYQWLGWDCCCPADIEKGLSEADGGKVILYINSPGGYCDVGSEIYTMLMEYEGEIEAHIMTAASAASVVACAADRVLASDTMIYMIHNSHGVGRGDYRDMISESELLMKCNESIINAYVRKTGKSREELQTMMDHTTWMSAKDAIKHGFVDDYLFGNPEGSSSEPEGAGTGKEQNLNYMQAMNALAVPVISTEKAMELRSMLKMSESFMPMETAEAEDSHITGDNEPQDTIVDNSSDIATDNPAENYEGGDYKMTLQEFLEENPEARKEFDERVEASKEAGVTGENDRLKALDEIAASVTPEALAEAKYGERRMNAESLAYQTLVEDRERTKNYMAHAIQDSEDSGVNEVGSNTSDPEEPRDESDSMAAIANAKLSRR